MCVLGAGRRPAEPEPRPPSTISDRRDRRRAPDRLRTLGIAKFAPARLLFAAGALDRAAALPRGDGHPRLPLGLHAPGAAHVPALLLLAASQVTLSAPQPPTAAQSATCTVEWEVGGAGAAAYAMSLVVDAGGEKSKVKRDADGGDASRGERRRR